MEGATALLTVCWMANRLLCPLLSLAIAIKYINITYQILCILINKSFLYLFGQISLAKALNSWTHCGFGNVWRVSVKVLTDFTPCGWMIRWKWLVLTKRSIYKHVRYWSSLHISHHSVAKSVFLWVAFFIIFLPSTSFSRISACLEARRNFLCGMCRVAPGADFWILFLRHSVLEGPAERRVWCGGPQLRWFIWQHCP